MGSAAAEGDLWLLAVASVRSMPPLMAKIREEIRSKVTLFSFLFWMSVFRGLVGYSWEAANPTNDKELSNKIPINASPKMNEVCAETSPKASLPFSHFTSLVPLHILYNRNRRKYAMTTHTHTHTYANTFIKKTWADCRWHSRAWQGPSLHQQQGWAKLNPVNCAEAFGQLCKTVIHTYTHTPEAHSHTHMHMQNQTAYWQEGRNRNTSQYVATLWLKYIRCITKAAPQIFKACWLHTTQALDINAKNKTEWDQNDLFSAVMAPYLN